jgi:hypothetical protein
MIKSITVELLISNSRLVHLKRQPPAPNRSSHGGDVNVKLAQGLVLAHIIMVKHFDAKIKK